MEVAGLNLLPNDFSEKSPDNFIIMQTSDKGLQIKAKGLGVSTITLKDFLRQLKCWGLVNPYLRDEIIGMLNEKPSLKERKTIAERVSEKIIGFVETFISGIARP